MDVLTRTTQLLATAFVVTFLVMGVLRLAYPFEAAWLESAMYTMMKRLCAGQSPYAAPSVDYAPCLYPPLYFHLAAWLARARAATMLPDFLPLRLVSATAALGVFSVIAFVVRVGRRRPWQVALLHAAFWLALDGRWEGWLDASRVDSLYTFFLVLGVTCLFEGQGWGSALLSGFFAGAGVLTKQPAALLWLLALLVDLYRRREPARLAAAVVAAAVAVMSYLIATGELHNPYFFFWLLVVPASHALSASLFLRGVFFVALTMTPWLVAGLAPTVWWFRGHEGRKRLAPSLDPWSALLGVWLFALLLLRAKEGASINFFMPLAPVIAISAAAWHAERETRTKRSPWAPAAVAFVQFAILLYDPRPLTPTPAAAREASAFVAQLRHIEGDVWIPAFPSYAAAASKPWHAHVTALADLRNTPLGPLLRARVQALSQNPAYGAWLPDPREPLLAPRALVAPGLEVAPLPAFETAFLRRLHDGHLPANLVVRATRDPFSSPAIQGEGKDMSSTAKTFP